MNCKEFRWREYSVPVTVRRPETPEETVIWLLLLKAAQEGAKSELGQG